MGSRHRSGGGRIRLTMLGPSPEHPGGITKVVESWRKGGLAQLVELREIHTSRWDDPRERQAAQAAIALAQLLLLLIRRESDVVFLHVSTGGSLFRKFAAAGLARLFKVPYVVQIHSGEYEDWVTRSFSARWISRLLFSHSAAVIVVAERWIELARRLGASKVRALPNALSLDEREAFAAAAANAATRSIPTLLYYGRWSPVKGPDRIAAALANISENDYKIRLFGNGDRKWMEEAFAVLPPGHVTIGGWIGLSGKANELASATALIVPSRSEGFGQVLIEARAVGTPVVASAVGGVEEILDGYDLALLVAAGDDDALRSSLERVVRGDWPRADVCAVRVPDLPERFYVESVVTDLVAILVQVANPAGTMPERSPRAR